jgi:hypothetical protein
MRLGEYPSWRSKSEFRPIGRYHFNLIAIEAFKYARVQVLAGPNKHRGAAILAKVTFNFVGCEAKERVRRRHIAVLINLTFRIDVVAGSNLLEVTRSVPERHIGLNSKGGPSNPLCY